MYTLIGIIIILIVFIVLAALYSIFKPLLHFIVSGLDAGFSLSDVTLLWETAKICGLEQPDSLFYSLPALTKCMTQISNQNQSEGPDSAAKNHRLLAKLFDYRTKIQNESDNKKGLVSTKSLDKGQTLRIILPGKGVFVSEIVNNGANLIISVPKQKGLIPLSAEDWVGKVISVYLWRKGDARYVFDTTVLQHGLFLGKSSLYIKHSANLVRTQKRKSVRAKCQIYGSLYIVKKNDPDDNVIETKNGYRCLIEDISESGALIKIGGKGIENVKIKLQFSIQNKLILMSGVIRTVDYNENENLSYLHFECIHIEPLMRNEVLSYVYNMLPESEKEVLEALSQTDDDVKNDETADTASETQTEQFTGQNQSDTVVIPAESEITSNDGETPAPVTVSTDSSMEYTSDETLQDNISFND